MEINNDDVVIALDETILRLIQRFSQPRYATDLNVLMAVALLRGLSIFITNYEFEDDASEGN